MENKKRAGIIRLSFEESPGVFRSNGIILMVSRWKLELTIIHIWILLLGFVVGLIFAWRR